MPHGSGAPRVAAPRSRPQRLRLLSWLLPAPSPTTVRATPRCPGPLRRQGVATSPLSSHPAWKRNAPPLGRSMPSPCRAHRYCPRSAASKARAVHSAHSVHARKALRRPAGQLRTQHLRGPPSRKPLPKPQRKQRLCPASPRTASREAWFDRQVVSSCRTAPPRRIRHQMPAQVIVQQSRSAGTEPEVPGRRRSRPRRRVARRRRQEPRIRCKWIQHR